MTTPLERVDVQRVLNPVTPRAATLANGTFASVLADTHPPTPSQGRGREPLGNGVPQAPTTNRSAASGSAVAGRPLSGGSRASAAAPWPPKAPAPSSAASAKAAPSSRVSATTSGAIPFQAQIDAAAKKYGIDPALLAAVAKTESNFNAKAQSGAGAKGLMQLMDSTARGLGVTDSFDPAQSLEGGARFLSGLLKQFKGDVRLALAAYNAGPGAVQKYGGIPPYQETQRYVPKVLTQLDAFRRIWADHSPATENS